MKRSLFFLLLASSGFAWAQPPAMPTTAAAVIYFPAKNYADPSLLQRELPQLAGTLIRYDAQEAKPGSPELYFLHQDYDKSLQLVDSVEKKTGNLTENFPLKVYALAKLRQQADGLTFDDAYKKSFVPAFNALSFNQKMYVAGFDSATVAYLSSQYAERIKKLKAKAADSLSLQDARDLCEDYIFGGLMPPVQPLFASLTADPRLRKKFPLIKSYPWAAVVPVTDIDEVPDPTLQYNLLMELTAFALKGKDSAASKEVNGGLGEVARVMNLHAAAGVPTKNLHVVVVVHGRALNALLNNEKYKKKYGIDNPNTALIKELQATGVKMIACGQALFYFNLDKPDLAPGIHKSLTAQTVLSSYQLKHYVHYDIALRE